MISVSYILLCGQFLLLLAAVFLQCLGGIHSENSSTTEPAAASPGRGATTSPVRGATASPGRGATAAPGSEQPPESGRNEASGESTNSTDEHEYNPPSPVVLCRYLPEEFIICQDPVDHALNYSAFQELGHGCVGWGGQTQKEVNHTKVMCTALEGIECAGSKDFLRGNVPCIKWSSVKCGGDKPGLSSLWRK